LKRSLKVKDTNVENQSIQHMVKGTFFFCAKVIKDMSKNVAVNMSRKETPQPAPEFWRQAELHL
jgi:hypothetical protein